MTEAATSAFPAPASGLGRPGRRIALGLLTAAGAINFIDRQILSVLVEPIRADLHFSDTQFGLLTGLSFAVFYGLLGVPVALLADRTHRVRLVACACFLWSFFTGACGFAGNFWALAAARFGVGVGEAGGTAPSLSILADYFPPDKRAIVTGLFTVNGPVGVFLGASLGGLAAHYFGWRGAFLAVSCLGLLMTPLLLLIREPVRGGLEAHDQSGRPARPATPTPFGRTVRLFLARPTLRWLLVASGLAAFVSYGMLNWIPAFLMRVQHMPLTAVATWFGPVAGLCMGLGIWGGGALVNLTAKRDMRAYGWVPGAAMLISGPTFAASLFAPSWQISLAMMTVPMVCCTMFTAPALALAQNFAPVTARATATALLLLAFNLVGLGGGPLALGAISDSLTHAHVVNGLRLALLFTTPCALLAAGAYYALTRAVVRDLAASASEDIF